MSRKNTSKAISNKSKSERKRAESAKAAERIRRRTRYDQVAKSISKALNVPKGAVAAVLNESSFMHVFEEVEDYRDQTKITYILSDLLALAFMAIVRRGSCEFEEIADHIEVNKDYYEELGFIHDGQVPSHDTFRTVFSNLDAMSLREKTIYRIYSLLRQPGIADQRPIQWALDGKEVRGTGRAADTLNPARNKNCMNLYDVTHKVNILADPIDSKTNEIPVAEDLINLLDIKDIIITADAIQTKSLLCDLISFKEGYYVFPVKDARTTLYKTVDQYMKSPDFADQRKKLTIGDREFEYLLLGEDQKKIPDFSTVQLLAKMTSYTRGNLEKPFEMYFISNMADAELALEASCSRWAIENELHKLKDSVVINEDKIRFRDENALRNMTVMTDLIALLINMFRLLEPDMKLKIAKLNIQDKPLESMLKVLNALGDEEFIKRLREDKPKQARRKRKTARSKDAG